MTKKSVRNSIGVVMNRDLSWQIH